MIGWVISGRVLMDGRVLVGEVGGKGGDAGRMEEGHHQLHCIIITTVTTGREDGSMLLFSTCGYIHHHHCCTLAGERNMHLIITATIANIFVLR